MRTTALICWLVAALPAQAPKGQVAFAAGAKSSPLTGVAWLCGAYLPSLPQWPTNLSSDQSIVVHVDGDGIHITPNNVPMPEDAVAVGSFVLQDGVRALCACRGDGAEDWYVPLAAGMPAAWDRVVDILRARDLDRAHTIDLAVALGHLLGPVAEGEGRALQLGAALCGEVTWQAWRNTTHLRVRGRSDGGLTIPAALLLAAADIGVADGPTLPMRAFAARDGDRGEAVRQLSRGTAISSREALLAMLHGSDDLRLAAIDSLVRLRSAQDLPRIVGAAAPAMPLAAVAAADAVDALWSDASVADRERTRQALAQSPVAALRNLNPGPAPPGTAAPSARPAIPWRLLGGLFLLFCTLFTFWLRERARATAFYA